MNKYFKISKFGFTLAEMMIVVSIMTVLAAATLPVITKRANTSHSLLSGSIVMWSGTLLSKPPGFAVCDGNFNTPDLRGYFVLGADGGTYNVGKVNNSFPPAIGVTNLPSHTHSLVSIGNSGTHTHSVTTGSNAFTHNHTVSFASSSHNHGVPAYNAFGYSPGVNSYYLTAIYISHAIFTSLSTGGAYHTHTASLGGDGGHTHTATTLADTAHGHYNYPTAAQGAVLDASGNITLSDFPEPKYYALYYIMKL